MVRVGRALPRRCGRKWGFRSSPLPTKAVGGGNLGGSGSVAAAVRTTTPTELPLIDFITTQSQDAVETVASMARDWDTLEMIVDADRFTAVQARFRHQQVDAIAFSAVVVGYYRNLSQSGSQPQ